MRKHVFLAKMLMMLAVGWLSTGVYAQCIQPNSFGTNAIPNSGSPVTVIGAWAGEFTNFTGTVTGEEYSFSSTNGTDYLTLTDASDNVLVFGITPLTWTATFDGVVRVHISVDSGCGAQNTDRNITAQCTTCVPPPPSPGDNCANPISILCAGSESGTTVGRPTDPVATCGTTTGTGGKVWYQFTGTGEFITASLCGSTYDTKIWVFEGACNALNCVVGNDDFCGVGSEVTFTSTLGATYYIVVGGFGGAQGDYTLNVTCQTVDPAPGCATNFVETPTPACDNDPLTFSWDAVPTALGYRISVGTTSGGTNVANNVDLGNVLQYVINFPLLSTQYFYTVTPYNLGGDAVGCTEEDYTTGAQECFDPGDNCDNTIAIACGGSDSGTTVGRPTDAVAFCGTANGTGGKVWYEFTGNGDFITASLCGSSYDTKIWVFEGTCNALNCVVGNDDACGLQSEVSFTSNLGATYYIVVGGFGGAQGAYTLNVTCQTIDPAPGCATNFVETPTPACDNDPLTFSWDAVPTALGYRISVGTTSGGTNVANNVDLGNVLQYVINNPLLNTQYFYTVTPYNLGGDAVGCAEEDYTTGAQDCSDPGDNCDNPIAIACGGSDAGTTVGRPTDAVAFCGTTNGTGGKVWYEFTGNGDFITASLCGSTFDTKIWVFEGACNALNCVVGNDDFCGLQSEVQFASTNGSTYYIVVGGFGAAQGAYTLNLTCVTPPAPPTCATNVLVTPTPNCDNYDITLEWDPVVGADGYNVYAGTASGVYDIANPFDNEDFTEVFLQNPSLNTEYFFLVVPYNLGGEAIGCVNEVSILTGNIECACIPQYTFGKTDGDLISNVEIPGTTLANNTGTAQVNPAFTYFTGQPNYTADLIQGGSYNVTISIGTWGDQAVRAWIDYNDDGVFDDTESIGATTIAPGQGFNAGGYPPAVFNVNLSNSAPLGTHRMRVRSAYFQVAATLSPCDLYAFGETEDYDITIVGPVTTQLQAGSCGATNVAPNQLLFATNVGAPAYRFRFTGANNGGAGWNSNAFVVDRPNRYVYFNHLVPGFQFGATYSVEVAVGDGFGNFGPYGSACDVTLQNNVPLTQIQSSQCGETFNGNTLIFANQIYDAQGYRFRITGANNGGAGWNNNEFILDRTVRNFYFSWLVPGATPGATFSVEVAYLQNDGVTYSPYGSACNITLTAPTTQIQASQCGIIDLLPNTLVFANQVFDAQGYRFRVTGANNGGAGWNNNVFVFDRPNRNFTFQWNVPGSLAGEAYQVEVAYLQNDGVTYSAYGAVCNVTLFGTQNMAINDENEIFMADKSLVEVAFGANASHNPFTTEFGIQVLNANDTETINVVIYDMSGKLIERNAVNPMDIEAAKFGSNLASGMYMIEVRQGSNQAVIRQVKN